MYLSIHLFTHFTVHSPISNELHLTNHSLVTSHLRSPSLDSVLSVGAPTGTVLSGECHLHHKEADPRHDTEDQ